ncbi:MAG: hypothetical protein ABI042_00965 [Verrucomicrobiota bacterium]
MKKIISLTLLSLALGVLANRASAGVIFSDDFESGTVANWYESFSATGRGWTPSTVTNIVPTGGTWSMLLTNSISKMHRNIIADNGGFEVSGHAIYSGYIYDDGAANLAWFEVRGYSGGTGFANTVAGATVSGSLSQLIAIGKSSGGFAYIPGGAYDPTKYQCRSIANTTVSSSTTWYNLDGPGAPNRSFGWHKFAIEQLEDGTTLKFYVDDILCRTILGNSVQSWDTIFGGAGNVVNGTTNYLDGMTLTTIADTNKPTIQIAYGSFTSNEVNVVYSESVDDTVINTANYSLSGGLTISSVDRTSVSSVRLNTSDQTPGTTYTLTVNGVQDLATNVQDTAGVNTIAANSTASFTAFATPQFYANFNDAAIPSGTAVYGNAFINGGSGFGGSPMLDLTEATANQNGSFIIEDLNAGQVVGSFTASFRVRSGGGSAQPAEGFSFNLGSDLPSGTFGSLDGNSLGLAVIFDAFNQGTDASSSLAPEAPAIDIKLGGNFVAHKAVGKLLRTGVDYADVLIKADLDGKLTVVMNGSLVYSNLVVYTNKVGGRFALSGITGGAFQTHYIDDLGITTVGLADSVPPTITSAAGTGDLGCSSLTEVKVVFSEAVSSTADNAGNYSLSGAVSISGVTRISPSTVVLTTSLQNTNTSYTLTVNNVQDTALVPNTIAANSTKTFTSFIGSTAKFYTEFCVLPPNAAIYGDAVLDQGILKLTSAIGNQGGSIVIEDLDAGSVVGSFDVNFKALIGGGSGSGADGYSFNFGNGLPDGTFAEEGAGNGLTITFDTYNNSPVGQPSEAPAIRVKFDGILITNKFVSYLRTGTTFTNVSIHVDPDGTLDLTYGTNVVFSNLLAYTTPIAGGRFGFGARTGGVFDNHWLDNLSINTFTSCGTLTIAQQGSDAVITWSGPCALESADNVEGPYSPVGASSPYTTPIADKKFFKLHGN